MTVIESGEQVPQMAQASRPSSATVSRLALLAIDTLDAAIREGDHGPVERTALHKLALGYLLLAGVTAPPQVATLWQLLGHEGVFEQMNCRQSHGGAILAGMRDRARAMGRPRPG